MNAAAEMQVQGRVRKSSGAVLLKLRFLYLFAGLAGGLFNPYLTTLLVHQGVSSDRAGFMMAMGTLISIFAQPFWGMLVDRYRRTRLVLLLSLAVPAAAAYFYNVQLFAVLMTVYTVSTLFQATQYPIADSYAVDASREARTSYGTIRSLGSLGTALGGFAGGVYLSQFQLTQLWFPFLLLNSAAIAVVLLLPAREHSFSVQLSFAEGMRKLFRNRSFLIFLAGSFLVNQTLTAYNSFFVLSFQMAGGSYSLSGVALLLGSLTNVPAMLIAAVVLKRIGHEKTLMLSAAAYVLRWAVQWLFPYPGVMVGVQVLHGLSFGFFYIAAVEYVAGVTGREMQATGQSVFNMVFVGLSGIVGNLLNGYFLQSGGPGAMYAACAFSALLGAFMLYWLTIGQRPVSRTT